MGFESIQVMNVMGFGSSMKNRPTEEFPLNDAFTMNFSNGINVLIGNNGTGKTSILKMIYAAAQNTCEKTSCTLEELFSANFNCDKLNNSKYRNAPSFFKISSSDSYYIEDFTLIPPEKTNQAKTKQLRKWRELNFSSVFIPTTEILSHSRELLVLHQRFGIPFGRTIIDIIANASLPETKNLTHDMEMIAAKISRAIDGTVLQENETFYIDKSNGQRIDFSLESEGFCKLGLLWKIIRNGLLEPGSILIWDEPESNLNPDLFPLISEILLELQENGVQIFVATHSYNVAMYLEIRRKKEADVVFHNLYKQDGKVSANSALRMDDLSPNHIILANNVLLDEIYEM